MFLTKNGTALPFVVEESAHAGVVRVAGKVIADVEKVSGVKPELLRQAPETPYVLCATLCRSPAGSCSPIADALIAQGKLPQAEEIRGAWERFVIAKVDGNLIILGSDKRGTEFGMFELSKYIGVSPLCYWGDADPLPCADIELKDDICTVSREPSVKYRGLFINDEWPCFGTWATTHFGENVDIFICICAKLQISFLKFIFYKYIPFQLIHSMIAYPLAGACTIYTAIQYIFAVVCHIPRFNICLHLCRNIFFRRNLPVGNFYHPAVFFCGTTCQ